MGHFNVLYIQEGKTIEELYKKHQSGEYISNRIDEEFARDYWDCCGEYNPRVEPLTDYCGLWGNVLEATTGIKCDFNKKDDDLYEIVNLKDLTDHELNRLESRVYMIIILRKDGRRKEHFKFESYEKEYHEYLEKLKKREITGICGLIDCHW